MAAIIQYNEREENVTKFTKIIGFTWFIMLVIAFIAQFIEVIVIKP